MNIQRVGSQPSTPAPAENLRSSVRQDMRFQMGAHREGRERILAVTAPQRVSAAPDIPSVTAIVRTPPSRSGLHCSYPAASRRGRRRAFCLSLQRSAATGRSSSGWQRVPGAC
jgi:hypothetical protein